MEAEENEPEPREPRTDNRVELELVTLIFKLVKKFSSLSGRAEGAYEKLF